MADLALKKRAVAVAAVAYAQKALALVLQVAELRTAFADNGFQPGGANAITQQDLDASGAPWLTPALLEQCLTDLGNVNLNPAQRTTMRRVSQAPVPPAV